jgi:beta-glucanase (GH16 family)
VSTAIPSDSGEFGLFAFGATFVLVGVGVIANVSQVRYPRIVALVAPSSDSAARMIVSDIFRLSVAAAVAIALFIPVSERSIGLLFPRFAAAAHSAVALAVSGVPLALVAWTLPVSISLSRRPWTDAARVFGLPLLLLAPAMWLGEKAAGLEGQAWGSTFDVCVLAALQCLMLRRVEALSAPVALRCALFPIMLVVALCSEVVVARAQTGAGYVRPAVEDMSFHEDFRDLRFRNGAAGLWSPIYAWGGRTIPDNKELEFYVDPRTDSPSLAGLSPFAAGASLAITARPVPNGLRALTLGLPYASGLLTTEGRFSQTYGYFEIRAKMPTGRGLWPAFWLGCADGEWPPEIDVVEAHGDRLDGYWGTIHWRGSGGGLKKTQFRIATPSLDAEFHDYGVEWQARQIRWIFDGRVVAEAATPTTMNKPMYLIVNLAVGGDWPGDPDSTTRFPASLEVQHVTAYRLPADSKDLRR